MVTNCGSAQLRRCCAHAYRLLTQGEDFDAEVIAVMLATIAGTFFVCFLDSFDDKSLEVVVSLEFKVDVRRQAQPTRLTGCTAGGGQTVAHWMTYR